MDVSNIVLQQGLGQTNAGISAIKNAAKNEGAIVQLIEQAIQSAPSGGRGQNLDITV